MPIEDRPVVGRVRMICVSVRLISTRNDRVPDGVVKKFSGVQVRRERNSISLLNLEEE